MFPFSPTMFRHQVLVRAQQETTGPAAGVAESFPSGGTPVPCRVRFSSDNPGMAPQGELSVTLGQVAFPTDPGVRKGYRLLFGTRTLWVVGPAQARDADGVLWVVNVEVRD